MFLSLLFTKIIQLSFWRKKKLFPNYNYWFLAYYCWVKKLGLRTRFLFIYKKLEVDSFNDPKAELRFSSSRGLFIELIGWKILPTWETAFLLLICKEIKSLCFFFLMTSSRSYSWRIVSLRHKYSNVRQTEEINSSWNKSTSLRALTYISLTVWHYKLFTEFTFQIVSSFNFETHYHNKIYFTITTPAFLSCTSIKQHLVILSKGNHSIGIYIGSKLSAIELYLVLLREQYCVLLIHNWWFGINHRFRCRRLS